MSSRLRVGIAGFGVVGKRRRQFVDQHPSMQTVAVADRSFDGNGTLADGVRFYQSYEQLIATEELDVLLVCLTNDVAPDATIRGLEKGLHVFCEKPPARSVSELAEVLRVEKAHPGLTLKYGFNHRYHDSVRDALRIIRSGELGRVLNLRGVYGKSAIVTFNQSDWRTRRELAGGGVLLDQGIHMVDMMRLFAGEFSEIHSFISNSFWNYDVEDNAYALMRTADGIVAMLHSSATQWRHRFHLEIALERGTIVLSGILSGSKSYGAETITVAYPRPDDAGDPREVTTRYNQDNSWRDEIEEFADSVLHGTPVTNGSSADAMRTMELVYRIYCADPEWRARYELEHTHPGGIP
jgi:predicted dehydrogenase